MQKNESHIKQKIDERLNSLPGLNLEYKKSADEVWTELTRFVETKESERSAPVVRISSRQIWTIAAAIVVVLLASVLFMRLYTTEVYAPFGKHVLAELPDGSQVRLNAGSEINYHPLWWSLIRKVNLTGEAFFEVKKGKKFEVVSKAGSTIVLGTSFNIFARDNNYKVTCYTGKVRVVASQSRHSLDIVPNEQASLNRDGSLRLSKIKNIEEPVSWMNDMFIFTGTPLDFVFDEIERQYDVNITVAEEADYLYTGNFTRNQPLEQVLKMVCRPYGLHFQKTDKGYIIVKE
jgi:ferric-dicitrate binding protein FerR (iron transport regulator)